MIARPWYAETHRQLDLARLTSGDRAAALAYLQFVRTLPDTRPTTR